MSENPNDMLIRRARANGVSPQEQRRREMAETCYGRESLLKMAQDVQKRDRCPHPVINVTHGVDECMVCGEIVDTHGEAEAFYSDRKPGEMML